MIADKVTSLYAAQAIASALYGREKTGRGVEIEVPMFEVMTSFVMTEHLAAASFDQQADPGYKRLLNRHRRPFRSADGWIAVLPYTEAHWRRILDEIGRADVMTMPWFDDATDRSRHVGDMYEILARHMTSRTTDEWVATLERIDVPHSRVNSLQDLLTDEHLESVGFFRPTDGMPSRVRSVPQPVVVRGSDSRKDAPPPDLGTNTRELMEDLGYSAEETQKLLHDGIVRMVDPAPLDSD